MMSILSPNKAHHYTLKVMGCAFVLTAIHNDPKIAWRGLKKGETEIRRIEALISSWDEKSETSLINNASGKHPVCVSHELYNLIERSKKISALTAGAFDITGTLARYYWEFDKKEKEALISQEKIVELRSRMGYQYIHLNKQRHSVFLEKEGMKIGFGGIGKGYAAEMAMNVMKAEGIESGLVNASGDLKAWGSPPNKDQWEIGIPDPTDRRRNLASVHIPEGSLVTSGSSEYYFLLEGKRYSHIIDPRTGMPVTNINAVSVICPNAEFADGMATALSVLNPYDGLHIINSLAGIEAILVSTNGETHISQQLKTSLKCDKKNMLSTCA